MIAESHLLNRSRWFIELLRSYLSSSFKNNSEVAVSSVMELRTSHSSSEMKESSSKYSWNLFPPVVGFKNGFSVKNLK